MARNGLDVVQSLGTEHTQRAELCLVGQKEAFEACLNGAPLTTSLGILTQAAIEQMNGEARAAFYIADDKGKSLRHVVGMPEDYARCVDGFIIAQDSLTCGLAAQTRQPVITEDVMREPAWGPWRWLSEQFEFRGCWSFPVQSPEKVEGTFALYFRGPRRPTETDLNLATVITNAAAIIISRTNQWERAKPLSDRHAGVG